MKPITRREFIHLTTQGMLAVGGLVGLGALIRFLSYEPEPPLPREFSIGPAGQYPLGSRTMLAEIPAILLHTPDGLKAFSLVCPHLGCVIQEQGGKLTCPCHGSQFDEGGQVTRRPATRALKALQVTVLGDGSVVIYT
jgi:nitrite reductase/ring-hydroxylating ferredoxin subunit